MTSLITLDPAMHVMVLTTLKIATKQLVLDVNLTSIIIPHINVPRHLSNRPFNHNTPYKNNTRNTHETNSHTEPSLQLSVSTNKPDQMAKLLETTKKMTKYFKRPLKHIPMHTNTNDYYQNKVAHLTLTNINTNPTTSRMK